MATLQDVDLTVRVRTLRAVLKAEPNLSAEQRAELVAPTVWPAAVETPSRPARAPHV